MALMAVMTLSVNQQRGVHASRVNMMKGEMFSVASGVANEQFERLAALPFDSLHVFAGATEDVSIGFESDTFYFQIQTDVTYATFNGSGFKASKDVSDFQEVTLTVTGELDAQITTSRVYNRLNG